MTRLLTFVLLGALALTSARVFDDYIVHEKATHSKHWVIERRATAAELDRVLEFSIAVKLTNVDRLEELLLQVSDPEHIMFGNYVTVSDLKKIAPPCAGCIARIVEWLSQEKAMSIEITPREDYISFKMHALNAERLFRTEFCVYSAPSHKQSPLLLRTCDMKYSLPSHISASVDFVSGLLRFHKPQSPMRVESAPQSGNTPRNIRPLYNVPLTTVANSTKQHQAVGAFLNQWYSPTDLQLFFKTYIPELEGEVAHVHGENKPSDPGTEASLDIQYISSMGTKVPIYFWSNDDINPINHQEPWTEFLKNISKTEDVPQLFSVSYGDDEWSLTHSYMSRCNTDLIAIGARGISMLVSSGDSGAGCNGDVFDPTFPAASPYVTSVGATTGVPAPESGTYFSSGGFSNFFPRPSYQKAAVQAFLDGGNLPPQRYYNSTGRGFPDVSAVGSNVLICQNGVCDQGVAGTSCSAPIFSGIISLINNQRVFTGKAPIGFLNIALYKQPSVLTDIVSGSSTGCDGNGWNAEQGWDPITGLGTPDYEKLRAYLLSL